ncbi:luciferin 4-monooxygenase-like isoform X2 [Cimex lectularius]|uniref:Luciferin 4-monooxygenase n=1 Tax=Cimex lectularius TaxID=79782 RepID=A0A8I6SSA3_CIMLE|nr:luciferin 4-monooxygenase-like isoform X2 [Cimex lectularius]
MTDREGNVLEISGPPAPQLDADLSLAEVLLSSMRKYHVKSIAEFEVETGRELTYGHMVRESLSAVQGLKSEGVTENSVVSVISFNSQECHVVILACIFIGATVAPIDPSLTAEEMVSLMELVSPTVVFTEGGKTLRKVENALMLISAAPLLVVSSGRRHSYLTFQALLQPTDPEFRPSISNPEDHVAFVLFTSGTSGLPKGVMLTDVYLLQNMPHFSRKIDMQPTALLTSPVFWLSGAMILLGSLIGGLKLVFLRGPSKEAVLLSSIQNYKANIWFSPPTTLNALLNFPGKDAYDLSSLVVLSVGGAILSADSALRIQKELFRNKISILQGYGMTEMGVIATGLPGLNKPGSCGVLKPGIKCRIEDLETGDSLGPGQEGEICLKSPFMMKGYINNPEATAATFDDNGWFHTGDIGYYDEDGFLFVIDRLKDLFFYKSYQIAPAEIENVLRTHPAVKDVAVFGIPHPIDGDHATAFVVANKAISETQLLEFVAERVSEKKQIRGGIRFVEFIPKTSTGKPKRKALRAQLLAELQGTNFVDSNNPTV